VADEKNDPAIAVTSSDDPDDQAGPAAPPVPSETAGTGSYIAVSCTAVMVLLTLLLIAGLLLSRWL
jgi:hypothetical protein